MDRIVVLDGGRIVEEGTPTELVERDGLFLRLWKRQTGGFMPEELE
jgi:ATP-binding cassette subfamily B protein/ATP-binding cassette subfamily B multidrug efflux pump